MTRNKNKYTRTLGHINSPLSMIYADLSGADHDLRRYFGADHDPRRYFGAGHDLRGLSGQTMIYADLSGLTAPDHFNLYLVY